MLILLGGALAVAAAEAPPARARASAARQPVQASACNDVPAHPFDLILGRPTPTSVTVSVLCYADTEGCLAYGTEAGKLAARTAARTFKRGETAEVVLSPLQPNTRYVYQFQAATTSSPEYSFHTARPPGSAFTFTVTADSHLDENTDPVLYQRTLANARADAPDFHLDLGDTFMTEKHASRESAARQYLAQRFYLGQLCSAAPLFFVLGNHDGESPRGRGSDADSLAVWSGLLRKRTFPNPVPDGFYSGNLELHPDLGPLQDYYAWEWGDALLVVLDPYWFAERQRGQNDNWKRTLGQAQYDWLRHTLESSRARFSFVFIHHLVGGADAQARGGAEAAPFYEWGGRNADGSDGFATHRPGWPLPIHALFVQTGVSIVFHGHDHLYAKQDLDGIVYQEVPQPGCPGNGKPPRSAAEYGYVNGTILGGSGHLRVKVSPRETAVAYVRTDGTVAHSYVIPAGSKRATGTAANE
jgi:predicted phosphodiesterase